MRRLAFKNESRVAIFNIKTPVCSSSTRPTTSLLAFLMHRKFVASYETHSHVAVSENIYYQLIFLTDSQPYVGSTSHRLIFLQFENARYHCRHSGVWTLQFSFSCCTHYFQVTRFCLKQRDAPSTAIRAR